MRTTAVRWLLTALVLTVCLPLLASCGVVADAPDAGLPARGWPVRVGFSQAETPSPWTTAMVDGFFLAAEGLGMELVYHEPTESTGAWQLADLQALLEEELDYLIIFPRDAGLLDGVLAQARQQELPVILFGNQGDYAPSDDIACLITNDYEKEGRLCAQILARHFEHRICKVVEITGSEDSVIATSRIKGFRDEIAKHPNIWITSTGVGNGNRLTAQYAMENIIINLNENSFNAVFACSDEEGLGVLQALKVAGFKPGKDISIVSVNGTQDVLKAIVAGEYTATIRSDTRVGYMAFEIIQQWERGFKRINHVFLAPRLYDDAEEAMTRLYFY